MLGILADLTLQFDLLWMLCGARLSVQLLLSGRLGRTCTPRLPLFYSPNAVPAWGYRAATGVQQHASIDPEVPAYLESSPVWAQPEVQTR